MDSFVSNSPSQFADPIVNILGFSVAFTSLLMFIGIVVLIFLIIRELVTWYWKITEIVEQLKDTNETLSQISRLLTRMERNTYKEEPASVTPVATLAPILDQYRPIEELKTQPKPIKPQFLWLKKSMLRFFAFFKNYKNIIYVVSLLLVIGGSLFAIGFAIAPFWHLWVH